MRTEEFYRRKADKCVAAAKMATLNEERARQYALAEHYMRLAMDVLNASKTKRGKKAQPDGVSLGA